MHESLQSPHRAETCVMNVLCTTATTNVVCGVQASLQNPHRAVTCVMSVLSTTDATNVVIVCCAGITTEPTQSSNIFGECVVYYSYSKCIECVLCMNHYRAHTEQ